MEISPWHIYGVDVVIFIGWRAGSTTTEHGKMPGRNIPVIHIDIDPMVTGANYRCDVRIVADPKFAQAALLTEIGLRGGKRDANRRRRDRLARLQAEKWRPLHRDSILARHSSM